MIAGRLRCLIALMLSITLAAPGCAAARAQRISVPAPLAPSAPYAPSAPHAPQAAVFAEFARTLPPGTPVRVDRTDGHSVRGTLMKVSDTEMVVQPRTRIPEPPVQIPFQSVVRITPESASGSNLGRAIGIGIAAGVGAVLGLFAILAAIYAD